MTTDTTQTLETVASKQATREEAALCARARALGFSCCGISAPRLEEMAQARLHAFVAEGQHGTMAWFARRLEERLDPKKLWNEARSAIVLGIDCTPEGDARKAWQRRLADRGLAHVATYALGEDYHEVVKKRLKTFARWLCIEYDTQAKVFVDTAPLSEKSLAAQAGVGWVGKNTQLVSRTHGCWLLLGVVLTARMFQPTSPSYVPPLARSSSPPSSPPSPLPSPREVGRCGSCRRCLEVCPTKAFPRPYALDARRCLSYLTIEHRGVIPREFRVAVGNRVFGCDDCLAVCPWNKFARAAQELEEEIEEATQEEVGKAEEDSMAVVLRSRADLGTGRIAAWLRLEDGEFRRLFRKTVVKRLGIARFRRNLLVAAGNSEDATLLPLAEELLADEDGVVRASALWAVWRLGGRARVRELAAAYLDGEEDETVREEWAWCCERDFLAPQEKATC